MRPAMGEIARSVEQAPGHSTRNPADVAGHALSPTRNLPVPVGESAGPALKDAGDSAALFARVQAVEKELAAAKAEIAEAVGEPIEAPPNLPDRFKEKALLDALQTAIKQTNPNAEVTSIDCTEYPCIAYSKGLSLQQFPTLRSSPALQVYAQDTVNVIKWGDLVGFVATPKEDPSALGSPERNAAQQRIMVRLQQMAAATSGH
jgi:hypothetical protein